MNEEENRYYIYGRTRYETPLTFIKTIEVAAAVKDESLAAAGDEDWVELISIPAHAMIHVIGEPSHD